MKLLNTVKITGMVLICATNPYFGLNIMKGIVKGSNRRKEWNKVSHSLRHLKKRGLVQVIVRDDGVIETKITKEGQKIVDVIDINNLRLRKKGTWDGKWRVVIFDIPNDKSNNRLAFTRKLRELGFIMVQRSVWAYPYNCRDEIAILRDFYEISKYVTYIETAKIEDEHLWHKHFNSNHV